MKPRTPLLSLSLLSLLVAPWQVSAAIAAMGSTTALPPARPSAPAYSRADLDAAYTLGPGDRVKIEVFKVPQYSLDTQVLVDGTISLLQTGKIKVQGLTLDQASEAASNQYAKLLKYPVVTVTLITPRPIRVGVSGEVTRQGSYDLSVTGENNTNPVQLPTVTRALRSAGGTTQAADLRQVQILRPRYGQPDEKIAVNLLEFIRGTQPKEDIFLRDGDSIYIPTSTNLDLNESYEIATTSFSADRIQPLNVTIVGEVYRPGTHTVESNVRTELAGVPGAPRDSFNQSRIYPTITRALQTAGGIKPLADIRQIQLRRTTRNGAEQNFTIDLWQLLKNGDQKQDLILQDRDTIVVPEAQSLPNKEAATLAAASFSPDKIRVSVVGEVERPGLVDVPPNTPFHKAILAAGGFNNRADRKKVEFIRLNPDSTVARREIAVNFAQNLDETTNPPLRNEDVIVVKRSSYSTVKDEAGNVFNPVGSIVNVLRAIFRF
jgi:polysaccharide biosynthesis/export protein